MNALPCFASIADAQRAHAEDLADRLAQAESDALDAMQGTPGKVEDFLVESGADVSVLLSLLFADGLPLRDKSESDDKQLLRLTRQVERLQREFNAWAIRPSYGMASSPLRRWMAEDAA